MLPVAESVRGVDLEPLLTADELADWLNVTKEWIYDEVQKGALPHVRLGRMLRFERRQIEAHIEAGRGGS